MKGIHLFLIGCLAVLLIAAGCTTTQTTADVGILYTKGTGPMPTLLATKQIDGYIAWQPFVEVAPVAHIGKVITYSGSLPPDDRWKDHPCCVLTARTDFMGSHQAFVDAMGAATILSTRYITAHPSEAADIVADWLAGKGNFTYGNISVSSVEVLDRAFPTVKFVNEPSEQWMAGQIEFVYALRELGTINGKLANTTDDQTKALLFDTGPYNRDLAMIDAKSIVAPQVEANPIGVGYLLSDHHASLFVAVKKWQYFNDTYGIALKPEDPTASKPDLVDLLIKGQKVATLKLIPADAGPQLMQLAATNTIQMAYVGNPPAISAIDQGTPLKILMALNNEGSGVVVVTTSPATDWPSFVQWAKERAAAGKPIKMAAPGKGSIQDVMLRYALEESGLSVKEVQA
ncbi:MAG TPA: ABC transporter substrate-binding protein [Methanomicrobiales archaeon]|jgi:NitT/TauT family transport system substrate-binding protein|nr:ABC transporter substrate-binding protein [Methanomicrobiales archaeon]